MNGPKNGIELLLHLVAEETDMLKYLFMDSESGKITGYRLTMFCWDKWPENKRDIVERCIRRGLIEMAHRPPTERGFSFWCIVQPKAVILEKSVEELKEEYFKNISFPVLFLTMEGKEFLQK